MKIFVGIDPGKAGAISFLNEEGKVLFTELVPVIGKEYDKHKMFKIFDEYGVENIKHVVIEDVHATSLAGSSSSFEFGFGKALWEMAVCAHNIPHTLVQPKAWQKETWEGVTKIMKPLKAGQVKPSVDNKATSLVAAKRLFPGQTFLATPRSKVPNDGLVDATLMAEYCRRKFK